MDSDNESQGSMAALVGLEIVGEQTVVAELLFGEESHKVYVRVSETFAEDEVADVALRVGNGWAHFSAATLRALAAAWNCPWQSGWWSTLSTWP